MADGHLAQPQQPGLYYTPEGAIDNIVDQIDPKHILDNLDHALRGEVYIKEKGIWEKKGAELVNDDCRESIISYITPILTNNTTMSILDKEQLSRIMETIIENVSRMFVVNLERFGFVPPGPGFVNKIYENKGTPDSARMSKVSNMVYMVCFLTLSRALNGMESSKIFRSLSISADVSQAGVQQKPGFLGRLFGR